MVAIISFFIKINNFLNIENLKTRFLTTLILLAVFSFLFFLGEFIMSLVLIVLFGGILYELKFNYSKKSNIFYKFQTLTLTFILFLYFISETYNINLKISYLNNFDLFLSVAIILSILFFYSLSNLIYTLISILVVFSFFSIIQILSLSNGLYILFYIVILVSSMDVFAYLGGNVFGRIKIAPNISNGKTVEGTFIGLFFTILISILFKNILLLDLFKAIFFGTSVGFLAFWGDLIESLFKRKVGVKDSGSIIPGHGGLLDRFDGYILVIPFAFLFFNFLI